MNATVSNQELARLLVLIVHLASTASRDLDDHMVRDIRRCWAGLQQHRGLISERDVFWAALYRHHLKGYSIDMLSELTGISIGILSVGLEKRDSACFSSARRTATSVPPVGLHQVDPNALDDPSRPITGYMLGFLWAQGLLMRTHTGIYEGIRVVLPQRDYAQLELIRRQLGSNAPITYPLSHVPTIDRAYPKCELRIFSQDLAARLVAYGYGNRVDRQREGAPPAEIRVAEAAYWRGLLDGDGCIRRDPRVTSPNSGWSLELAANRATCELFHGWLLDRLPHAAVKVRVNNTRSRYMRVVVLGASAVEAMAILYPPGCIGLERNVRRASSAVAAAQNAGALASTSNREYG